MGADTWYCVVTASSAKQDGSLFAPAMTNDNAEMPNEAQGPKQCHVTKPRIPENVK